MSREMKDSGIEWIGLIPKCWTVNRIKEKFSIVNGSTPKSDVPEFWDGDIVWVTPIDMYNNVFLNDSRKKITESGYLSCGTTLVPKGSIVISTRAPIGQISIAGIKLCTNQGCKSLVATNETNERYLFYLLSISTEILNFFGRGTTFLELSTKDLANFVYSSPTLNIQNRIVDYLDKQCATIDRLISLQEEMIAELQAYKQSVITEAVTKGLDPDVPMKDSGVEWIGEIPNQWGISKLTNIFIKIGSGTTPDTVNSEYYEGNIKWVQSGDINGAHIYDTQKKVSERALAEISTLRLYEAPFIVIAMYGASIANASISMIDACVNQACCVLSGCKSNIEFIFFLIVAAKNSLVSQGRGGGQPNISQELLKNQRFPQPSSLEQEKIVEYIKKKCDAVDNMLRLKQQKIDYLKQYKKSLIYECVTGKREIV